jgi:hypothetical protein
MNTWPAPIRSDVRVRIAPPNPKVPPLYLIQHPAVPEVAYTRDEAKALYWASVDIEVNGY